MKGEQPGRCDCGCESEGRELSRRGLLGRLLGLLGGMCGLSLLSGCPGGSTYGRSKPGTMVAGGTDGSGKNLSRLEWDQATLPDGVSAEFYIDGKKCYLLRASANGKANYVALRRRCPHSGCTVTYSYQTNRLQCPCHGSTFLADGTVETGPARKNLTTYPVKEENGKIIVEVPGSLLSLRGVPD